MTNCPSHWFMKDDPMKYIPFTWLSMILLSFVCIACIDDSKPDQDRAETQDEFSILDAEFSRFVVSPFNILFNATTYGITEFQIIEIRNIGTITGIVHDIQLKPEGTPFLLLGGHHDLTADDYYDPDHNDEPGLSAGNTFMIFLGFSPELEHSALLEETNQFNAELIVMTDDPFEPEIRIPISGSLLAEAE